MDKQRVIVYIDGFNFYYGLKKDARWKKSSNIASMASSKPVQLKQ